MAQTFDGAQFPDALRFTLSGTPNNCTEIVMPNTATTVSLKFSDNDGKVAFEGTDGAAINANFVDITADAIAEIGLGDGVNSAKGVNSIFVASATASTVCTVVIEG